MEKKINFKNISDSVSNTAKKAIDSAVQTIDRNGDGKLDKTDLNIMKEKMGNAVQEGAKFVAENARIAKENIDMKTLAPLFPKDLEEPEFYMQRFIRVSDREKKFERKEICNGSIGKMSSVKGNEVLTVFRDSIQDFKIKLVPDENSEFYYVDPSDSQCYIALDDYFAYLKLARISELQMIAQELGAKYFKVTYKEEKTSFSDKRGKIKIKATSNPELEKSKQETEYSTAEIAAEMSFLGHEPKEPQIKYLEKEADIRSLVSMRMHKEGTLLNKTFMLRLSNTTGIKEKEAAKIDTILSGLKCSGNTTVESEARNEARRFLEYDIRF